MGLGDIRGTEKKSSGIYERNYSSRLAFRDYQHNSGKMMNFNYKSGMLIISIDKIKEGGFETETIVDSWITVTKAKLLLEAIEAFKNEKTHTPDAGYGISTGMGETQRAFIIHGTADGKPAVTIGKYNGSNGSWIIKDTFEFNDSDFHFFLNWTDISKNGAAPIYDNSIEFDMLENTVRNFANSMDGAAAYAAVDMLKVDFRAVLNKMDPIYDKLGIERFSKSRTSNNNGNFFGNNGGSSEHKSIEDVMGNNRFGRADSSGDSFDDED